VFKRIVTPHIEPPDQAEMVDPQRYSVLRRKILALMAVVTILPLFSLAALNYYEHQASMAVEIQNPLRVLVGKTKNSFELFLAERTSTVSLIASAYPFADLSDEKKLRRIFQVMRREFVGFVDLGLIDSKGNQVSYVGPYDLAGRDYAGQAWFHQVQLKGKYLSDVFMGFRKFPHVVIAVQHTTEDGRSWVLRATIDTSQFDHIIASMSLESGGDAFLVNRQGVLQTDSRLYGKVLDPLPMPMPAPSFETNVLTTTDPAGRDVFLSYTYFADADFVLMAVKPRPTVLKTWYSVRADLLVIFLAGVAAVFLAVYRVTDVIIRRLHESDERRVCAIHQMEHSQKLSSIGRLAAGVAHEINNPLAIMMENAGWIEDLLSSDDPYSDENVTEIRSSLQTITIQGHRCREITHKLLSFARKTDTSARVVRVNPLLEDIAGFARQKAKYREVEIRLVLDPAVEDVAGSPTELQQILLNLVNNAIDAIDKPGGLVELSSFREPDAVRITVSDNGQGIPADVLPRIFDPFFTTKAEGQGTGLGLAICRDILSKMNGTISVDSTPGNGSTFRIRLPLRSAV